MILSLNSRRSRLQLKGVIMSDKQDMFDKDCVDHADTNINMCVPWYIMASYAYYVLDDPILTDSTFDRLCRKLLENWDSIEHIHKHLLTKEALLAGTYLGEYPSRIHGAIESLRGKRYAKQNSN